MSDDPAREVIEAIYDTKLPGLVYAHWRVWECKMCGERVDERSIPTFCPYFGPSGVYSAQGKLDERARVHQCIGGQHGSMVNIGIRRDDSQAYRVDYTAKTLTEVER